MISSFLKDLLEATTTVINKTEEDKELEEKVPETDIHLHTGDEVKVIIPDYLVNVYPEKLNQLTLSKGVVFRYHFLSKSLHFWIEIVQNQVPHPDKLSKKNVQLIKEILNKQDNFFFKLWAQYLQNKQNYQQRKQEEAGFVAPGKSLKVFEKGGKRFEMVYLEGSDKELIEFRKRFEFFLVMFIDGASSIDSYENTWGYYIIYELDQENQRHFAGLLSKYVFKITHTKQRERISQVLVLPCYQKLGLAKEMVDQFYGECIEKPGCLEITVEGPSFQFQCLRNFKEVELVLSSRIFEIEGIQNHPLKIAQDIKELKELYLTEENIIRIKKGYKLPGQQIDTVVNILIFARVLESGDQMLRAHFDEFMRQKILGELAAFKDRDITPFLFIDGQPIDTKNYLLLKNKEEFLLRTGGEVEQVLRESLEGYKRVADKLRREKLVGKERVKEVKKDEALTETELVK